LENDYLSTFPAGCISFANSNFEEDEIFSEEVVYFTFLFYVLKKIDWHVCRFDLLIQTIDMSDYVGLETLHFSALAVFNTCSQI